MERKKFPAAIPRLPCAAQGSPLRLRRAAEV